MLLLAGKLPRQAAPAAGAGSVGHHVVCMLLQLQAPGDTLAGNQMMHATGSRTLPYVMAFAFASGSGSTATL